MFDLKVAQVAARDDSSKHTEDIEVEALSIAHQIPDMCDSVRSVSRSQRLRGAVLHMCCNTPSRGSNILMRFVEEKFVKFRGRLREYGDSRGPPHHSRHGHPILVSYLASEIQKKNWLQCSLW